MAISALPVKWKKGDVVEVHFDMIPRIVKANPKVEADHGRVAVERGPIVYCAEWAGQQIPTSTAYFSTSIRNSR